MTGNDQTPLIAGPCRGPKMPQPSQCGHAKTPAQMQGVPADIAASCCPGCLTAWAIANGVLFSGKRAGDPGNLLDRQSAQ
jgi:hypothetical protein